jgi:predicted amidophosphoribosyltransferase
VDELPEVDELLKQVPGFGQCGTCLYNTSGPAELCFACARHTMEPLAASRCPVCDRPYAPEETACGNPLCNRDDRWFSWNVAISMRTGELKAAISRYKYDEKWGWAYIFGRVVAGFLEEQAGTFRQFDAITASPTHVGPNGRSFNHTRMVLERAAAEVPPGVEWPFDIAGEPLIVKTGPTPRMVGNGYRDRRDIAEGPLRDALRVTRPEDVSGKRVLVYDDVFTDGLTLNEVARALRLAGATEVCGVTLCRQPYGGQPLPR